MKLRAAACAASVALPLSLLTSVGPAHGFAEDVCRTARGTWTNCTAADHLAPPAYDEGSRSTVHMDSTYYLAQAVGLTPAQALTVAAYDAGVDLGQYHHRDRDGTLRPSISTGEYVGLDRSDFVAGGVFFHFMAPVTGPAPVLSGSAALQHTAGAGKPFPHIKGLRPDPTNPFTEPMLADARRWAYGKGPLCVAGLTVRSARGDYATGKSCYHRPGGGRASMLTSLPLTSQGKNISELDFSTPLGEMPLTPPNAAHPIPASQIARLSGKARAPFARLGIYLHALQDRVSHHRCIDESYAVGPRPDPAHRPHVLVNPAGIAVAVAASTPTPAGGRSPTETNPDFITTFAQRICDQQHHSMLHGEETATDQSTIVAADRTTYAALRITLHELQAFVRSAYGRHLLGKVHPHRGHGLVPALEKAEQTPTALGRLDALTHVGVTRGLKPLPGY